MTRAVQVNECPGGRIDIDPDDECVKTFGGFPLRWRVGKTSSVNPNGFLILLLMIDIKS